MKQPGTKTVRKNKFFWLVVLILLFGSHGFAVSQPALSVGPEKGWLILHGGGDARHSGKDLLEVVARYPELLGIGIDENTAIVVHDDQFEVIGEGKVGVFEGNGVSQKKPLMLSKGQRFDLRRRTAIR